MFQWFLRKRRISSLCQEYARQHGMLREYRIARANGCSPEEALEEWDLLTNEIMMKIQAERNQLIDIELPPPHDGDCTIISIESIGVTIRITPRADTPAPKRKKVSSFDNFIIGKHDPARLLASLHTIIDSKSPKVCALTLLAAIEKGILTQPTYKAVREEFPEIGDRKNYAYYLGRADNYRKEIASLLQNL